MKVLSALTLLLLARLSIQANPPAVDCVPDQCLLPDCLCSSTTPPMGASADVTEYPQIVMLSFDDAVQSTLYTSFYEPLFNYTNKGGCNIGLTFFLSHDYTDYTLVHDLYSRGYEIASHSITHQTPTTYWQTLDYQGWVDQMYGLKQIASYLANIPADSIIGTREPFLQGGGDTMFQGFYDYDFKYDCNMPTLTYTNPPLFPYTFDYKSIQDCQIPPCPSNSYPGFWEVPLVDFNASYPCAMLDSCVNVTGVDGTYQFLLDNFNKHYTTNRAPIGLFTHASWFQTDATHYPGYLQFIEYVLSLPDVYIVTVAKAIEWMKQPTKLVDIPSFEPWQCPSVTPPPCTAISCHYNQSTPGGERYMGSCVPCPPHYPWVGDPYGNITTTLYEKPIVLTL